MRYKHTLTHTHHIINREVNTEQCWHIGSYISLCDVLSIIYRHLWFRPGFTFDPSTPWDQRCECFSCEPWSVCSWKIRIMRIGYKKGTKRQLAVATLSKIKQCSEIKIVIRRIKKVRTWSWLWQNCTCVRKNWSTMLNLVVNHLHPTSLIKLSVYLILLGNKAIKIWLRNFLIGESPAWNWTNSNQLPSDQESSISYHDDDIAKDNYVWVSVLDIYSILVKSSTLSLSCSLIISSDTHVWHLQETTVPVIDTALAKACRYNRFCRHYAALDNNDGCGCTWYKLEINKWNTKDYMVHLNAVITPKTFCENQSHGVISR